MRWSPPRSLVVALAALAVGALAWPASPRLHGQEPPPPAAPAADADLAKRVEKLDSAINQHLDAGRIAEAVAPAREKLDLLERRLGKDHWRTCDARRDRETYTRLASLPHEVQDRYVKMRQTDARAVQLHGRGQYTKVALLHQEALAICRDILGADHPDTARSYTNLAETLSAQGKAAEAEAMHRRALAIRLKALGEGHPDTATCYDNLASTLRDQRKYAEAEAMHRRAWRSGSRPWARTTPSSPPPTTTWPGPSAPRGSMPRSRRCSAASWQSESRSWARAIPSPPAATTIWS